MQRLNAERERAYARIKNLALRFEEQKSFYMQAAYNETQTRRDFIDPFFKALGWDMDNENGYAESYREVIHEDRLNMEGGRSKAPDYAFRLVGGKKLFFVEAKKPSVLIKEQVQPAYQVRRYGWSAKLPLSIITDFQEFAVYDCSKKPSLTDKASTARIKYLTYPDYLKDFDFLWNTFSKQRVLEGSFDKFVAGDGHKRGTSTLDREFLLSLDSWRTQLAISISKQNRQLNEDQLNFIVQQTLDRIIFLRIAEDRNIEPYGNLRTCIRAGNVYSHLLHLFMDADAKYNSGLFDFDKDRISQQLAIDNTVLKNILTDLYFPCPYEFSVLPVEILGTAYEQFLGKQITIDQAHRVRIDEKPTVRKAGGVYYTPQPVVDYIVANTVGLLVKGKTPKQIEHLKIVDPACGSGSFLLGAYDFLLNYYLDFYTRQGKPSKGRKQDKLTPAGNLTSAEKKRILLQHIFGVDLDANATEVTKLSLLIKCMEGETEASIAHQMRLFHDRVLPTLDNNIRVGNSLVDADFADHWQTQATDDEKRAKPFHWPAAFPEVFARGGFDAVIGNPPWVQSKFLDEKLKAYFASHYESMTRQYDLFNGFIEKAGSILKTGGLFGFIIPNRFLSGPDYAALRKLILERYTLLEIADMGERVFRQVSMPSAILFFRHARPQPDANFCVKTNITDLGAGLCEVHHTGQAQQLQNRHFNIEIHQNQDDKRVVALMEQWPALRTLVSNARGVEIGKDHPAIVNKRMAGAVPFLRGKDMGRYYAKAPCYLLTNDASIDYKPAALYQGDKILVRKTGKGINATLDTQNHYVIQVIYLLKKKAGVTEDLAYILGLLNSKLLSFYYFRKFGEEHKQAFPHIRQGQLLEIPIRRIDFGKASDKAQHDALVHCVQSILSIQADADTVADARATHRLTMLDEKINQLVYALYGLNPDTIRLLEAAQHP